MLICWDRLPKILPEGPPCSYQPRPTGPIFNEQTTESVTGASRTPYCGLVRTVLLPFLIFTKIPSFISQPRKLIHTKCCPRRSPRSILQFLLTCCVWTVTKSTKNCRNEPSDWLTEWFNLSLMRIETRTEGGFSISLDEIVTWFHPGKMP